LEGEGEGEGGGRGRGGRWEIWRARGSVRGAEKENIGERVGGEIKSIVEYREKDEWIPQGADPSLHLHLSAVWQAEII
jgi:hypothetical protein